MSASLDLTEISSSYSHRVRSRYLTAGTQCRNVSLTSSSHQGSMTPSTDKARKKVERLPILFENLGACLLQGKRKRRSGAKRLRRSWPHEKERAVLSQGGARQLTPQINYTRGRYQDQAVYGTFPRGSQKRSSPQSGVILQFGRDCVVSGFWEGRLSWRSACSLQKKPTARIGASCGVAKQSELARNA